MNVNDGWWFYTELSSIMALQWLSTSTSNNVAPKVRRCVVAGVFWLGVMLIFSSWDDSGQMFGDRI